MTEDPELRLSLVDNLDWGGDRIIYPAPEPRTLPTKVKLD